MWNFAYSFNNFLGFNNFGLFNIGFMMPSFFNFGFGTGSNNYSPLFNFGNYNNYGYTPASNYSLPAFLMSSVCNYGTYSYIQPTTTAQSDTSLGTPDIDKINNLSSNTQRIIEYNKSNYGKDYYGIVDKKNCKLTIYDKNGNDVKSYRLGLGKDKGDGISGGKYTTAGEFTLDENVKGKDAKNYTAADGTYKFMALRGDNSGNDNLIDGIHMVPNNLKKARVDKIKSDTIDDNRMSFGCVNMLEEDYDKMYQYLREGCKIYILPEEEGNELKLKKQTDGSYKFEQTYHQDDERGMSNDVASIVIYDA